MSGNDDSRDPRDTSSREASSRKGRRADWTRADFEAAIPLYVGGDLEPADAERVERWIADHPEDAAAVRAADEARSVLLSHARSFELRETPDLWPGIRAELARRAGERAGGMERAPGPEVAGEGERLTLVGGAAERRSSWIERPAFAAAAAVLLVGTLGLGIARMGGGVPASLPSAPDGTDSVPAADGARFAAASQPAVIAGTTDRPLDVLPTGALAQRPDAARAATGAPERRRGTPLTPTNGDAEHLLPSAVPVHYLYPSLDPRHTPATQSGVRLTGRR